MTHYIIQAGAVEHPHSSKSLFSRSGLSQPSCKHNHHLWHRSSVLSSGDKPQYGLADCLTEISAK